MDGTRTRNRGTIAGPREIPPSIVRGSDDSHGLIATESEGGPSQRCSLSAN